MHAELFDELAADGFAVRPGDLGENITTRGIDLLGLPTGTLLRLGEEAVVEVTGLRNPCVQIDRFQDGLMKRLTPPTEDGGFARLAGIMGIVRVGGTVRAGDRIVVQLPAGEPAAGSRSRRSGAVPAPIRSASGASSPVASMPGMSFVMTRSRSARSVRSSRSKNSSPDGREVGGRRGVEDRRARRRSG